MNVLTPFFFSFDLLVSYKDLFDGAAAVAGAGYEQGCSAGTLGFSEGAGAGVLLDGTL